MNIAVTGATGLIGTAFSQACARTGDTVLRIRRATPANATGNVVWGIDTASLLAGVDAVVHLAGESIADGRWNAEKKRRIRDSRITGTATLARLMADMPRPPSTWICASAIGYYGDRADELLTEASASGGGFLAEVCQQWEAAALPAASRGVRVIFARFGMVLSRRGGALARMLWPFRLGVGGVVGGGRQYWSWVTLTDAVRALQWLIRQTAVHGPVNIVAPQPVTNREFTRALGEVLGRPTMIPLPATAARWVLGEMADALLLASARVMPARLVEGGFSFEHREIRAALAAVIEET
jgi:uncharacterized protein (TIGR01777 family)